MCAICRACVCVGMCCGFCRCGVPVCECVSVCVCESVASVARNEDSARARVGDDDDESVVDQREHSESGAKKEGEQQQSEAKETLFDLVNKQPERRL